VKQQPVPFRFLPQRDSGSDFFRVATLADSMAINWPQRGHIAKQSRKWGKTKKRRQLSALLVKKRF